MIINLSRVDFGGITGGKAKPEEVFDVQPTTADQTITPTEGSVFSGGTVRAVTKEIDANIVSNNIKEGVTILGVAGTLKEEKPEEVFDVQPTTTDQTITPTEGSVFSRGTVRAVTKEIDVNIVSNNIKEGVTILGVAGTLKEEKPEESFNVQPTTAEQTITPSAGSVFSGGTVRAVTSSIDRNIQPENIKEGVRILGVAGSLKGEKPEESFNIQPTTAEQTITPTEGKVFSGGTVRAVTSAIDSNIQPENIKEGVSILGVAGTLSGGSGGDTPDYRYMKGTVDKAGLKAIGWTDEDILTYEQNKVPHYTWQNDQFIVSDENKALYLLDDPNPSSYKNNPNITFVPKKNMESYFAKRSGFSGMKYIKGIPYFDTSNVTNVESLFHSCSSLTTVPPLDLSSATNVSYLFAQCSSLTTVPPLDLSSATNISYLFGSCPSLTTVPPIIAPKATEVHDLFYHCPSLTTVPPLDLSSTTSVANLFSGCSSLTTVPPIDTSKVTNVYSLFGGCSSLTTVEGIDFSGFTADVEHIFGYTSNMPNLTHFIVNGKINVSIKDNYSIKPLTAIDYESVKSILAAADRTDNTNAKELAFNRTMTDQNGELASLVSSCTSKGWTITGLTLQ